MLWTIKMKLFISKRKVQPGPNNNYDKEDDDDEEDDDDKEDDDDDEVGQLWIEYRKGWRPSRLIASCKPPLCILYCVLFFSAFFISRFLFHFSILYYYCLLYAATVHVWCVSKQE